VIKKFRDWAKSYSGFDGGDIDAEYWIAGIEYATLNNSGKAYNDFLDNFIKNTKGLKVISKDDIGEINRKEHLKEYGYHWPVARYDKNVLKLCEELDINNFYRAFEFKSNFMKFNLFPIPFNNDNNTHENCKEYWTKNNPYKSDLSKITGFSTKKEYKEWCKKERFKNIVDLIVQNSSTHIKVIIPYSKVEYYEAFKDIISLYKYDIESKIQREPYYINKTKKSYWQYTTYTKENHKVSFIQVPFLNYAGDDTGLKALAKKIKSLSNTQNISKTSQIQFGDFIYDFRYENLYLKNTPIKLSKNEKALLSILIQAKGNIVSFIDLEHYIWPYKTVADSTFRALLHRLRKKLNYRHIETVQGFGCKIVYL
jgi:hypothetical protein